MDETTWDARIEMLVREGPKPLKRQPWKKKSSERGGEGGNRGAWKDLKSIERQKSHFVGDRETVSQGTLKECYSPTRGEKDRRVSHAKS